MMNISVVIPTYNREKTIIRCLNSVLAQTFQPLEIIVVDDGSSDDTIRMIEELKSDKIRLLRQNHLGAQAARNYGIREAKGEYIAFLDSDDEWLPEKLEIQNMVLSKYPDNVVTCNGFIQNDIISENTKTDKLNPSYQTIDREAFIAGCGTGKVYKTALSGKSAMFQGMICPKDMLEKIGYLDEKVRAFQEWDITIMLAKECEFQHVREPLFIYHLHEGETISKNALREISGIDYIIKKYRTEIVKECGKDVLKKYYFDIFRRCSIHKNRKSLEYYLKWFFA